MNIGFFTDTYLPQINGVVTSIEISRRELCKRGHRVYVFAPRLPGGGDAAFDEANNIYRFYSVPYFRQKEHRVVFPFSREFLNFKRFNLDLIHTHTFFSLGLYAAYLARRYKIPVVHTYHTLWAEYTHYSFLPEAATRKAFTRGSEVYCNHCALVISPSLAIREVLLDYGVKTPIAVLPTGIEEELAAEPVSYDLKKQFGIDADTQLLTFAGRFGREKNLHFLLRAFRLIRQQYPACRLVLVGDGPEREPLREYATQLGLDEQIHFTGYLSRPQVMQVLAGSTLFLFSSLSETQGLVIIEAMRAGTPAVLVDAMGVSEIIAGNRGGLLCRPVEEEFAAAALQLLTDRELYAAKKKETGAVAARYSAERITTELIKEYGQVLERSR